MQVRHSHRLPIQCPMKYSGGRIVGEGTIRNLSADGFEVDGSRPVPRETHLSLRVFLDDGEELLEVEPATVRWPRGKRFGLKTLIMGGEDWRRLRRFIGEKVKESDPSSV